MVNIDLGWSSTDTQIYVFASENKSMRAPDNQACAKACRLITRADYICENEFLRFVLHADWEARCRWCAISQRIT